MKRIGWVAVLVAFLGGCAEMAHHEGSGAAWTNMIDGSMSQFDKVGDANWRMEGGTIVADKGTGFLYSKKSYGDFEIRVEFYAESDSNSGIFLRCQDTKDIVGNGAKNSYEVNIWDDRPKQEHATGAIVDVAAVNPVPRAGGKWNTFHITAKGDHFVVVMNGTKTVDVHDGRHKRGPFALQHAPGVKGDTMPIKFRKVEIRELS
jgi:hypothetical protein